MTKKKKVKEGRIEEITKEERDLIKKQMKIISIIPIGDKQRSTQAILFSLGKEEKNLFENPLIQSKIKELVNIYLHNKEFRKFLSVIMDSYSADSYSIQNNFVILKPNEKTKKIETILIGDKARDFLEIFIEKKCQKMEV